jgi:hypothetical protein
VILADGIAPDPEKVKTILSWPRSRNVTEIRIIVGLYSYYRAHVPRFAEVAQALHELTKKHAVFQWTDLLEQAFWQLKEALFSAPIFAHRWMMDDTCWILTPVMWLQVQYYNRSRMDSFG